MSKQYGCLLRGQNLLVSYSEAAHTCMFVLYCRYDGWSLNAGKALDIVYNGGHGDQITNFADFVTEMRDPDAPKEDGT